MKTTIRGHEVECSVKEFKELIGIIAEETFDDNDYGDTMESDDDDDVCETLPHATLPKISLNPKTSHRRVISSHQHWMKKDLRLLKKNSHLPIKKLVKMFSGRSESSLKTQLYLIRHNKKDMKRVSNPSNKNIPRFKYMNLRARTLMKDDGISWNDALKRASIEWNLVKKVKQ